MGTVQKVAVITGVARGIGAALVKAYRNRSYQVVATARSIQSSADDGIITVPGDIGDRNTAKRVIAEAGIGLGASIRLSTTPAFSSPSRSLSTRMPTTLPFWASISPASSI